MTAQLELVLDWDDLAVEMKKCCDFEIEDMGFVKVHVRVSEIPPKGDRVTFMVSLNGGDYVRWCSGEVEAIAHDLQGEEGYLPNKVYLKLKDCWPHDLGDPFNPLRSTGWQEPTFPISEVAE